MAKWRFLGAFALLTAIAAGAYWQFSNGARPGRAAIAALAAAPDGSPERAAAVQKLTALGPAGHAAMFECLRTEPVDVCAALPLATLPCDTLAQALPGFGEGGRRALVTHLQSRLKAGDFSIAPVVAAAMAVTDADTRAVAVMLAGHPKLGLAATVAPRLKDTNAAVRAAALTALAPRADVAPDEDLFALLNDADAVVASTCANVLLARGRSDEDVHLARKLAHPAAAERLSLVLDLQHEAKSRDVGPWLERLSQDHDAAVRAGAMRLAVELKLPWAEWMARLASSDPDMTVRKLAAMHREELKDAKAVTPTGFVER
jgi:hypothetical protein